MRRRSLTRRLVAGVLLAELACAAGLSAFVVWHEEQTRLRAFDVMLRGRGDSVLGAVQDAEDPEDNVLVDPTELKVPPHDVFAVLNPAGRLLGSSANVPPPILQQLEQQPADGYFAFRSGHQRYRAVRFAGMRVIDREQDKGGLRRPVIVIYASPTNRLWHESLDSARFSLIVSAALLGLTALVLVWFLRRSLQPVRELAVAAARVSVDSWAFTPPEAALRTRELEPMAVSIRDLLLGLRRAFERQRQFTGDAAHELKTSLAVLKSSLQLLTMRARTADQYERGLAGLESDVRRMEDLVEQMLALARAEGETVSPEQLGHQRADLSEVAYLVAARMEPLARAHAVRVEVNGLEEAIVSLRLQDAEVLCSNLLLNAIQHSPAAGQVMISVRRAGAVIELEVSDAGSGIAPEALPHVFERFYRAERSRSRESGGAGLGLAITKAIVDRSGGAIALESTPGAGTRVRVRLPAVM